MVTPLRRLLLGQPLPSSEAGQSRFSKHQGLALFSADALSSTAYASEEILRVLALAGSAATGPALGLSLPIALAIAALIALVTLSYRQTIHAYPEGASAYAVTRANLGRRPALIAAAALMADYALTVAVSVTAALAHLASALPLIQSAIVPLALLCLAVVALGNLRGTGENYRLTALPAYGYLFFLVVTLGLCFVRSASAPPSAPAVPAGETLAPLTLLVVLRAFASGCTALTGIEAIADNVRRFREPQARNASVALGWLAGILGVLFLAMTVVSQRFGLTVRPNETLLSQLAHAAFGPRLLPLYYLTIAATFAVLLVAGNTAFQDFPRLASLLARDGYLPRRFADLGDRLVYTRGILALAGLTALLIIAFHGRVALLLPLYAIGVFMTFTLSQVAMVRHGLVRSAPIPRIAISAGGAIAAGIVLIVLVITKFNEGMPIGIAWGSFVPHYGAWLIPAFVAVSVALFRRIRFHYDSVEDALRIPSDRQETAVDSERRYHLVLVLVPSLHRGILPALRYAQALSDDVRAVHIEVNPASTITLKEDWIRSAQSLPLVILESPFRDIQTPLQRYVERCLHERAQQYVTVMIPELEIPNPTWHRFLHGTAAPRIRALLSTMPGVIVTSYRFFADGQSTASEATP